MDAFSVAISVGLQYGIPLESYVAKFTNMRFEPAGITDDPDIRIASSVMDYIFRRLALDHLPYDQRADLSVLSAAERTAELDGRGARGAGRGAGSGGDGPVRAGRACRPTGRNRPVPNERAGADRPAQAAQLDGAHRVAAGPQRRRAALPDLRHEDAPGRQLLRLRGLRLHQRLQLKRAKLRRMQQLGSACSDHAGQ